MKKTGGFSVLLILIVIALVYYAGKGSHNSIKKGDENETSLIASSETQHVPEQPTEDWIATYQESGIEILSVDKNILYTDAEQYLGKTVQTLVTADASIITGKTIKARTPNNDSNFYSFIFEFTGSEIRDLDIEKGDLVAIIGEVTEISVYSTVTLHNCHILATGGKAASYLPAVSPETKAKEEKDRDHQENDIGKTKQMEGLKITVNDYDIKNHMRGRKKYPRAKEGFKYVTIYLDVHNGTTSSIDFTKLLSDNPQYLFTLRYDEGIDYNESYCDSDEFLRHYNALPAQGTYSDLAICFEVPSAIAEDEDRSVELILSKNKIITLTDDVIWLLR